MVWNIASFPNISGEQGDLVPAHGTAGNSDPLGGRNERTGGSNPARRERKLSYPMIPAVVLTYLASRGLVRPWKIAGLPPGDYQGAIVIPALAERETLFLTLDSLEKNPATILSSFFVLVVVNHGRDALLSDKQNNQDTLKELAERKARSENLRLAWVDAASPGHELPPKSSGVGMARKIGFDLALPQLAYGDPRPLLISLDADTITRPENTCRFHWSGKFPGTGPGHSAL